MGAIARENKQVVAYPVPSVTHNNVSTFINKNVKWATIKRGYVGIYHWWSKKHLSRYINEFAFGYNNKEISLSDILIRH